MTARLGWAVWLQLPLILGFAHKVPARPSMRKYKSPWRLQPPVNKVVPPQLRAKCQGPQPGETATQRNVSLQSVSNISPRVGEDAGKGAGR